MSEKKYKTRYRKWFDSHGSGNSTRLGSFPNNDIMGNDDLYRNPISTVNRKINLGTENQTRIPDYFVTLKPLIDEEKLFIIIEVTGVSRNVNVQNINLSGIQFDLDGVKIKDSYLEKQKKHNTKLITKLKNLNDDTKSTEDDIKNKDFAFVNSSHFYDFVTYGSKLNNGSVRILSLKMDNFYKKLNKDGNSYPYDSLKKHLLNQNPNNKILLQIPNFQTSNKNQSKVCIKNIVLGKFDEKADVIGMCLGEKSTNKLMTKIQKNRKKLKNVKKKLDIDDQ